MSSSSTPLPSSSTKSLSSIYNAGSGGGGRMRNSKGEWADRGGHLPETTTLVGRMDGPALHTPFNGVNTKLI